MNEETLKLLAEYDVELKRMRDTIEIAINLLKKDLPTKALTILNEVINEKVCN